MKPEQRAEAMRLAGELEQPGRTTELRYSVIRLLRTIAAEPAPDAQPVAWVHGNALTALKDNSAAMLDAIYEKNKWTSWHDTPLYLHPAPAQTPLTEESDDEFARQIEAMDASGKGFLDNSTTLTDEPAAWVVYVGDERMRAFDTLELATDWARQERLYGSSYVYHIRTAYLHPAPAQTPQGEPVACEVSIYSSRICSLGTKGCLSTHPAPAPDAQPVAEVFDTFGNSQDPKKCVAHVWLAEGFMPRRGTKLYPAPAQTPQGEWIGAYVDESGISPIYKHPPEGEPKVTITKRSDEEVRLRAELAKLYDLFQDLIAALGADQETGTHWGNNASAVKWGVDHPRTIKALGDLGEALSEWGPE